ncbi:DmsC/YnfH family molybdoenzyme membrane anchor subunit [Vreelandella olivaria]|uniref:DmsC/YnfH family molybdoenzyme membrane anchor subunit n=1 Tax=Vreelandella olivaria TaxID=390919 RepID=UPI00201E87CB|nr:DmsC/YnfH family molybdoenzyme membrane anchor subunit [Halomonas olivaria]
MGWHELPLVVFTVLAQCAVGAFILLGALMLSGRLEGATLRRLNRPMLIIWVLMGVAFAASTLHLGSPLRAPNALLRLGGSWLSNEIFFGSLFFALGGLFWLLTLLDKGTPLLRMVLLGIAMLFGIAFMYATIRVYMIPTVPTWNTPFTPLGFFLTSVIGGALLAQLLLSLSDQGHRLLARLLPWLGALALAVALGSSVAHAMSLAGIQSAIQSAVDLIPHYQSLLLIRLTLLATVLALWLFALRSQRHQTLMLSLSFVVVLAAEMLGRNLFYNLYMTVGL